MEHELDLLLASAIDSLAKLEVLLYLRGRPGTVQRPEQIAENLRRDAKLVAASLESLAQAGLVDRFPLGTGRHVLYGQAEDAHVKEIVDLLYERYTRDSESRARLVREITAARHGDRPT
jgi:predicted transcriptional regulator